jgi:hypothetical protein
LLQEAESLGRVDELQAADGSSAETARSPADPQKPAKRQRVEAAGGNEDANAPVELSNYRRRKGVR